MDCIGADLPMRNEENCGDIFDTRTFTSIVRILLTVEATEKTSSLDIKQMAASEAPIQVEQATTSHSLLTPDGNLTLRPDLGALKLKSAVEKQKRKKTTNPMLWPWIAFQKMK